MKPHLLHVFATFAPGGPQVRTARLMHALADEFRHSIVAMDGCLDARSLVSDEVEARYLDPPPRAGALHTVPFLHALVRRERPDLLLTYNWGAIEAVLAGRLARVPILHHEDGFRPDEAFEFKRRRVWARRILLRSAQSVIVPSHTLHEIATKRWKLRENRVHRIPNGVRPQDFPPADGNLELRRQLGIPLDAFVVGFVGHLRAEKNPVRLVEAFATLELHPRAHLLMLGDGPERDNVLQAACRLGVDQRVHLVGHQPEPAPYYRAMDVFAISSDTEQLPVALLEAMACALPVVTTEVGDAARILPKEARALVVPLASKENPDAATRLGLALDELACEPAYASMIGAANRLRVVQEFSFDLMLESYRASYARTLGCA